MPGFLTNVVKGGSNGRADRRLSHRPGETVAEFRQRLEALRNLFQGGSALHTIAARWIYSFVPYDDWTDALFGVRLSEAFSWDRNHFDRLVHFAYGVCLTAILRQKWWRSLEIVLATSAAYELLEWAIAMTLGAEMAEAYNGQQGDMWDAHADMALAALGALITSLASSARRRSPVEATR